MRFSAKNWISGLVCGALALFSVNQATAQSIVQPPVISAVDQNGVNLADGTFVLPGADVGIGAAGSGLARRTQGASDSYSGAIKIEFVGQSYGGSSYGKLYMNASIGAAIKRFYVGDIANGVVTYRAGPYTAIGGGNDTLSCTGSLSNLYSGGVCTLTSGDGSTIDYDNSVSSGGMYWGMMQTITKAEGEVITLSYYKDGSNIVKAVKSVGSTLGWMLKYEVDSSYVVTKVTAINTSISYCDPSASSCSVSSDFPYVTQATSSGTTTIARNGTSLLSYSTSGNTITITSPGGLTKSVVYSGSDTTGKVASVTSGGSTWSYAYATDSSGTLTTTVTAPNSTTHKLVVTYDHKIVSQTDEAGRVTYYYYDGNQRVIEVLNPDGNVSTGGFTQYEYDGRGNATKTLIVPKGGATNGVANSGAAIISSATYSSACDSSNYRYCNKPLTTTDPNGVVTTYTYDASSGQVLTITLPAVGGVQAQSRYTYAQQTPHLKNSSGSLVAQAPVWRLTATSSCMSAHLNACVGGTDELKTATAYNTTNVLPDTTTTSRGDGSLSQTSTISYTDNGWTLVTDGPKSGAVDEAYYFYDALGRQVGVVGMDPDGSGSRHRHATHSYYDSDGRVYQTQTGTVATSVYSAGTAPGRNAQAYTDWQSLTVQAYDTNTFSSTTGLPTVARHYIGTSSTAKDVTQRSYDNMLRLDCEAIRLNPADFSSLPSSACAYGTAFSDGTKDRITKYNYDSVTGNLLSTVSAYGISLARTDVLKSYDTSGATSTGTLSWVEDANGNRTSYTYDSFNRLIKTCYPLTGTAHSSSTTDCEQTAYRTTTLGGTTQAGTLPASATLRDSQSISFSYDVLGRVSSKSGAVTESYAYDNLSQVTSHTNNSQTETYSYNALGWLLSDAQSLGTVSYTYDGFGKRTQMTYPGSGFSITYAYDDGDELTGIFENGSTQIASFAYDDYGRRTSLGRGNSVSTAYGYDSSLRLGTITQGASTASFYNQVTYAYAPSDQLASKTGTNGAYNYSVLASASTAYGANGLNQISTVASQSLSYDGRGNLSNDGGGTYSYNANNLLTSATQSGITSTLTYDAEDRLLSIAKNGTTTKFLYDGSDLIAEYDGSGTLLRRYVHGPGDDEPLVWYEGSGTGTKYYLGADD